MTKLVFSDFLKIVLSFFLQLKI